MRVRHSIAVASRKLGLSTWSRHAFFDGLPEDALVLIVQRLSTTSSSSPEKCPLLNLAPVSESVRRVIATTVGARLAFSVYENPAWFWAWLAVAGQHVRDLALHNRSFRAAGEVMQPWPMWPARPGVQLDASSALSAVWEAGAPLTELDVSGLVEFRRTSISALERLLVGLKGSLRRLKIDFSQFRIAVEKAKLTGLKKMTIVGLSAACEHDVLPVLRSMEGKAGEGCGLKELVLDACMSIPTIFRSQGRELAELLPKLELFHIDYDDDLHFFASDTSDCLDNLCDIAVLTTLKTVCFSGSGMPVSRKLVSCLLTQCTNLTDLRLIDCDVHPRCSGPSPGKACNEALTCTGSALTHYYPRWVTFKPEQLNTLAKHCRRLTHLRVFSAPGAEDALLELGEALRNSLVDLEVYPKIHEKKREIASYVVKMIQSLTKLERLCLVTLDLSSDQLKGVLKHCGSGLKFFSFSPPRMTGKYADEKAECLADVLLTATVHNPNLQRFECIFQDDELPIVKSKVIAKKLMVAVTLLESRATRLQSGRIVDLVKKMISRVDKRRGAE